MDAGLRDRGRAARDRDNEDWAERHVAAGLAWLWDDGGTTVAGASRIGPVYTPPAMRGRGYAGALTAHVSRMVLDEGALACLYTDLANPTSNRLYAAIAYEPVADFTRYLLRPGKPPDRPGAAG